jgi:rod shape-determining protein MreD
MARRADQLLMPVSPLFIWTTLAIAFVLNVVPLGRLPAVPDFVALVLVFWNVHQSRRVGVGVAFAFGLLMDVHSGAVLGQHALAYTLLSYFAVSVHRRLLWFTVPSQAVQILPLFLAAQAVSLIVRVISGGMFPGWELILAPVFQALLWPVTTWLLLAPQRRARTATRTDPCSDEAATFTAITAPCGGGDAPGSGPAGVAQMTELRNTEKELSRFRLRVLAAALFVVFAFGLLVARLSWLQVARHEELATQAENNRIAVVPITPNRGPDPRPQRRRPRQQLLRYTLEIAPAKVGNLEATIDQLGQLVEITARDRKRFRRLLDENKNFESVPIRTKLTDEEVARFTAQRFRFAGVDIKARLFRSYPLGEVGSHLIGYIGRINVGEKKEMDENWTDEDLANYRGTE